VRPFYFGESAEPLLGLHHPPSGGRARSVGVAILNPFGDEYLRAHRSLRQLADRLAGAGFHVLRFDYFGCGDSAGEDHDGRLGRWVDDAAVAVEELEALASSSRVALVGLRLGASLAIRLAGRRPGADHLVLWDPVGDGRLYLKELDAAHEVCMRENARRATGAADAQPPERLGFPLPDPLRAEIEALDLFGQATAPAPHVLVLTTGSREGPTLFPGGAPPGGSLEREPLPGMPVWTRGDSDAMEGALVPVEALERITAWLVARCP
jgi:pimeloyl-ACP methyl ester carboxylesterase